MDSLQELYCPSEEDLWRAAEAVVEAAVVRMQLRSGKQVSASHREALIDAVYRDPSMTGFLFEDGSLERH